MLLKLPLQTQVSLLVLMLMMGFFAVITFVWQIQVLRGRAMTNPDGSVDDWHEQKILYGMAFADVILACPACIAGVVLTFVSPKTGIFLLSMTAFWFAWANTMTTTTSLRFEQPKLNAIWWFVYPTGAAVGIAFIVWVAVHFNQVFCT